MPLFENREDRAVREDAEELGARRRGYVVVVARAEEVPDLVEQYCGRGWELMSLAYAGEGPHRGPYTYCSQSVVFRWPRERYAGVSAAG